MSMQTITVNGIKISYNSNVKKKSTESNIPLADDGLSLMIQATEAYVESGYQIKALEAIGAFSTEAAPGFVKKIGGGIKAAIQKIKEFFIKIGQYIRRSFLGTVIRKGSKAIYDRLQAKGIRDDWKTTKVHGAGNISKGLQAVSKLNERLNKLKQIASKNSYATDAMQVATELKDDFDSIMSEYNDSVIQDGGDVGLIVTNPQTEIVDQLKNLADAKSELYQGFKQISEFADYMVNSCNRSISAIDKNSEDRNDMVKFFHSIQFCVNAAAKTYTKICLSISIIGNIITNGSTQKVE